MGDLRSDAKLAVTIRARAAQVIDKQREKMRRNLGAAIDGRDPEGVHDMRVASRRLRAALALFEPWLDKRRVAPANRALRRLTRSLGRVRELDVLRDRLEGLARPATPECKLAIEIIDSRVARARLRARSRMIKSFASIDLDSLDTRLRDIAGAPPAWATEGSAPTGRDAGVPWNTSARSSLDEPIETFLERIGSKVSEGAQRLATTKVPGENGSEEAAHVLHGIRIQAKKLRYQLEIIAPHCGPEAPSLIETLKGVQEHLGEFHDDSVLDEILATNIARQAARARPLLVHELQRLRTARRAALRHDEQTCREELEKLRSSGFARAVARVTAQRPRSRAAPGTSSNATVARPALDAPSSDRRPESERYAGEPVARAFEASASPGASAQRDKT